MHIYNFSQCDTASCWNQTIAPVAAPVAAQVPVVTGEVGENDCGDSFIDSYMAWADVHDVSYLGWAWNTADCSSFPALITSYAGTPTAFGAGFQSHLAAPAASAAVARPVGGYVLDGSGGLTPFSTGTAPLPATASLSQPLPAGAPGRDAVELSGGYVVDSEGVVAPFAVRSESMPAPASPVSLPAGTAAAGMVLLPG